MGPILTWLGEHPGILGNIGVGALVVDRWVHKRQTTEIDHTTHLTRIDTDLEKLQEQASSRHSQIMAKIISMELDVTWKSTAAITRIDLTLDGGNYVSGSTFQLYGLL